MGQGGRGHGDAAEVPLLGGLVTVRQGELGAVAGSFAMFFVVLAAYYIVRPVRDEMGVAIGKDALHHLFTVVFFVMLAAVPAFGFASSRLPRRAILPAIYLFFAANLVLFSMAMMATPASRPVAATFFVWASVFNLFIVSLFWSLMSELWRSGEARRLYGFISAGGTAGALAGPIVTKALVAYLSPPALLLVSAGLLATAAAISVALRWTRGADGDGAAFEAHQETGGGILDGAMRVFASPYLFRIALFVFLANIVGTFFYMEQSRLVGETITDAAQRVDFFATRDLFVSIATVTIELLFTGHLLARFGLKLALMALPLAALASTVALSIHNVLHVVAVAMVVERVLAFALANPAIKVMYTLTSPDEKYKSQNFIDTVVYRGGDALSGWMFALFGAGVGFGAAAVPAVALPLIAVWLWNGRQMAAAFEVRAQAGAARGAGVLPERARL